MPTKAKGPRTTGKVKTGTTRVHQSKQRNQVNRFSLPSAAPKLESDVLQVESNQTAKVVSTSQSSFRVQDLAERENLGTGKGQGAFRISTAINGAIQNATDGTVFVDRNGAFVRYIKTRVTFQNPFSHDVEIRCNSPYSYKLNGAATNARSSMRSKILRPEEIWAVRCKVDTRSNTTFPVIKALSVKALNSGKEVDVTCNYMSVLDFAGILPNAPESTGAIVSGEGTKTAPATWNPTAESLLAKVENITVNLLNPYVDSTIVSIVEIPSVVIVALPDLLALKKIDPVIILPSLNINSRIRHMSSPILPRDDTPTFTKFGGSRKHLRSQLVAKGDKFRYRLVECDEDGGNAQPITKKELEDADIRIAGPPVAYIQTDPEWETTQGQVMDEYKFDFKAEEWVIPHEVGTEHAHYTNAIWAKERAVQYYDLRNSLKLENLTTHAFWDNLVGFVRGTVEILSVGLEVASLF